MSSLLNFRFLSSLVTPNLSYKLLSFNYTETDYDKLGVTITIYYVQSCYIEIEQKIDNIILLIYEC